MAGCPKCDLVSSFSEEKVEVESINGGKSYLIFVTCDKCRNTIYVKDSYDDFKQIVKSATLSMEKLSDKIADILDQN